MQKILSIHNYSGEEMTAAVTNLLAGNLVAFPTETVYGLGANASNAQAVAKIFQVKGRPSNHPLIVHIASIDRVRDWVSVIPEYAIKLAQSFWPGPMTLVFKRSSLAADFVTGGQETVGLRIPNHVIALELLKAFEKEGGIGVAAPSANRFGHVSPTSATAVIDELGEYLSESDLVLDGGACEIGLESTIIDCTRVAPAVLRPGGVSTPMIEECTGLKVSQGATSIRVSGSLDSHYAPLAKVLLSETAKAGQGLIAHASFRTPNGVIRLASPKSDDEFARMLYWALRNADSQGVKEVVVIQPSGDGIAVAIRDRLTRAANGR